MSRVFVARDEALGREVVVKVLAPELAEGLSAERFAREIRLAARLQHPNVVPVLAAGTGPDGLPYYTMPYIAGASLRERLAAGPLPVAEALPMLRDVARALGYAHAQGVVHRDVKPETCCSPAARRWWPTSASPRRSARRAAVRAAVRAAGRRR
jgi:serine/threonine-protein kinase